MLQKIKDLVRETLKPISEAVESIEIENEEMITATIKTAGNAKLKFHVAYKDFGDREMFKCALFRHDGDGKREYLGGHTSLDWHGMADRIKLSEGWIRAYMPEEYRL